MNLKDKIRVIEGFPKPGISFKDITTLLEDAEAFHYAIKQMAEFCRERKVDLVVGVESRGFILGAPLAYELGLGFALIRKPGKLPGDVLSMEYELEYGTDTLEIHKDAIKPGMNVVLVDDLLATGGTISAAAKLVEQVGAKISGFAFLIELEALNGRSKLEGYDILTLVNYEK
ncbi:MAG: adenine phosphoribosyltransferase [Candidatus Wallacebacter cryptica]|jgi:adenine phosphoribosyltransferase|nr:adenine phosphoribosyltransferase [Bacillota bacterium]